MKTSATSGILCLQSPYPFNELGIPMHPDRSLINIFKKWSQDYMVTQGMTACNGVELTKTETVQPQNTAQL